MLALLVLVLNALAPAAFASSMIRVPRGLAQSSGDGETPAPHCRLDAKFLKEAHETVSVTRKERTEERSRVTWLFEIADKKSVGGGACPESEKFPLLVTSGDFTRLKDGTELYVYPDYVTVPAKNAQVTLLVKKIHVKDPGTGEEYDAWIPTGWRQGVETSGIETKR